MAGHDPMEDGGALRPPPGWALREIRGPDGIRLVLHERGRGLALVMVPGGPGGWGWIWPRSLEALTASHRLVGYHGRGCGLSGEADEYSMAADLRDLGAVLEAVGPERVLLGHSYGGMLAQRLATLPAPPSLRGLVLVNTVVRYGTLVEASRRRRRRLGDRRWAEEASRMGRAMRGEASAEELLELARRRAEGSFRSLDHAAEMLAHQHVSWPVRLAVQRDILGFDVRADLARVRAPTLVTAGARDEICGDDPQQIHALVPGSRLALFEASGHSPFVEERARFVEVLGEWLDSLPPVCQDSPDSPPEAPPG